jgi:hypothetical protein
VPFDRVVLVVVTVEMLTLVLEAVEDDVTIVVLDGAEVREEVEDAVVKVVEVDELAIT